MTEMAETHRTKGELAELIDGRLEPEVRAVVEAHLSVCFACRSEVEAQRSAKDFAARHFAPTAVPPHVIRSVIAALQQDGVSTTSHGWRLAAAGVAAVALLTIALLLLRPQRDLASQVADSYRQFSSGNLKLEFTTRDTLALERWFSQSGIRFETRVFDLGMMQYRLVGGRVHRVDAHRSAFFVYRGPRDEILICQMYPGSVRELPTPVALRVNNGIEFHVHRDNNLTLVFWQEGEAVCVLYSDADSDRVIQLAYAKAVRTEDPTR